MNKKNILFVLLSLITSSLVFFVGYTKTTKPVELYRVYLKGETIGYIKDKELLEEYIDKKKKIINTSQKVVLLEPLELGLIFWI